MVKDNGETRKTHITNTHKNLKKLFNANRFIL